MNKSMIYGLVSVLAWATMAAATKTLVASLPNMEVLAVSAGMAFVFLLALNGVTGRLKKIKEYRPRQLAAMAGLGFLGVFLQSALYYYGLGRLTSQEACILNYLWPIMLVVFSCILLKEKLTPVKAAAMLCSFAGIVVLSAGGGGARGGNAAAGMVCCVVGAACYGLFSVLNKKADYDQNICMMVMWLTVSVLAAVLGFFTETWVPIRPAQLPGLLWLGVVIDAVTYLLWALALKEAKDTAKIANMAFLTPFLSLVISAVFLKETLRPQAFLALVLIVGGILLQSLWEGRKQTP